MVQNKYVFDPYPLQVTMQRLAENLKARRLETSGEETLHEESCGDERCASLKYSAF